MLNEQFYRPLGRSGLQVSPICLGSDNFANPTPEKESIEILHCAVTNGINLIDTANGYADGCSEEIIGKFMQESDCRDDVILTTKFYYGTGNKGINDKGTSRKHIIKACEDSLKRLKTDYIDLYQMHHIDRNTPWEEIWQAMELLVAQGKVLYIGSSNFAGWHIVRANENAKKRNFMGLVSEQSLYNLTQRSVELEVLPACKEYGLGFIPWSPLAGGVLGGRAPNNKKSRRYQATDSYKAYGKKLEKYYSICDEYSVKPVTISLAWLLSNPIVTAPIIGPREVGQLEEPLKAIKYTIDQGLLEKLDTLWPGPGGQAPEAYAW